NPKLARPVSVGSAGYAPAGESIHPPPVTNPADGSNTTTKPDVTEVAPVSSSVIVSLTVYTPAAEYVWASATLPDPPDSVTVRGEGVPSPHSPRAVCVSRVPTSVKVLLTWPADGAPAATGSVGATTGVTTGARLLTVTDVLAVALPVSSSVTVTPMPML